MTMTVLVPSDRPSDGPSDEGRAALADLDSVSLVVYDPDGAMPDEAGLTRAEPRADPAFGSCWFTARLS